MEVLKPCEELTKDEADESSEKLKLEVPVLPVESPGPTSKEDSDSEDRMLGFNPEEEVPLELKLGLERLTPVD
jgi:hypothetical protein